MSIPKKESNGEHNLQKIYELHYNYIIPPFLIQTLLCYTSLPNLWPPLITVINTHIIKLIYK